MRCCVFLLALSACASEGIQPPEAGHCAKLRDHLVDLQVADIHIATGVDREAHRCDAPRKLTDSRDAIYLALTSKLDGE